MAADIKKITVLHFSDMTDVLLCVAFQYHQKLGISL